MGVYSIIRLLWRSDAVERRCEIAEKVSDKIQSGSSTQQDVDEAINACELTLETWRGETIQRHPRLANVLANYATVLWVKYKELPRKNLKERCKQLQKIIGLYEQVLDLWQEEPPSSDAHQMILSNLANTYWERGSLDIEEGSNHFDYHESLDLQIQIYTYQPVDDAHSAATPKKHAALSIARVSLAIYEKKADKSVSQLDDAISKAREALAFFEQTHDKSRQAESEALLAEIYDVRFKTTENDDDLSEAIKFNQEALKHYGLKDPRRLPCIHNLALDFLLKHSSSQNPEDIKKAKDTASQGKEEAAADPAFCEKFEKLIAVLVQK